MTSVGTYACKKFLWCVPPAHSWVPSRPKPARGKPPGLKQQANLWSPDPRSQPSRSWTLQWGWSPRLQGQRAVLTGSPEVHSLSLSLFSLLSSVAVKRHRGCDCHLYRQSVRLPKANQSSWLCVFIRQHLPPPALLVPTPDSRAGWGQSRTTETVETAGARGKRPQRKGCVSPVLCEGPRHVETFKATSEQQRTSWLFKEEGLGWGRQARKAHPASPQPAVPAAWGWRGGS